MGWYTRKATSLAKVNISINNISINHLWYYKIEMSSRLPYMWFTFYLYMLPCPFSHLPCVHYTFVQWYLPCLDICTQGQFQGPRQILRSDRVAKVAQGHGGPPPKSLDSNESLWAKIVPLWVKNSVSWARSALLHGIYCIFHWVNFANLRLRTITTHLTRKL